MHFARVSTRSAIHKPRLPVNLLSEHDVVLYILQGEMMPYDDMVRTPLNGGTVRIIPFEGITICA